MSPKVNHARRGRSAHPQAGPAGELLRGRRGSAEHRRDVVERYSEHVVEHERDPLSRGERAEHHKQRSADRVGHQRLLLGIALALRVGVIVRLVLPDEVLAA